MMNPATVFIVDDDEAYRDSLVELVSSVGLPNACFASALDFLAAFDAQRAGCLVLDVRMARLSGLELQARLKAMGATIPIVFISGHGDIEMAVKAIKHGAVDFVQKPYREQQLLDAINEALRRDAEQRHAPAPAAAAPAPAAPAARLALLSAREREVMALALQGLPSKQIAKQLCLSHRTVEHHRSRLLDKLGVASMAELMRLNYQHALGGAAAAPPAAA
ncbi:MAG TPA: response regulator [Rubrivivax sp.]|nr:response regulator [Rubrivivax sp.]